MTPDILIDNAKQAMQKSYSPYSNFKVGAALLCEDGKVFTGCNIENSSYSATNCAERTALFKAIEEGERDFKAIAIVGGKNGNIEGLCPPCGVCRQVMSEFCDKSFKIYLCDKNDNITKKTLEDLLPLSFEF